MATKWPKHVAVYKIYIVINSHNFICTFWFCTHSEAAVRGHEVFNIATDFFTGSAKK